MYAWFSWQWILWQLAPKYEKIEKKNRRKKNKSHIDPKWNYVAHIEDEIVEKNNAPTVTIYPSNNLTLSSSEFVSHHENDDFFCSATTTQNVYSFCVPIFHLFNHFLKEYEFSIWFATQVGRMHHNTSIGDNLNENAMNKVSVF